MNTIKTSRLKLPGIPWCGSGTSPAILGTKPLRWLGTSWFCMRLPSWSCSSREKDGTTFWLAFISVMQTVGYLHSESPRQTDPLHITCMYHDILKVLDMIWPQWEGMSSSSTEALWFNDVPCCSACWKKSSTTMLTSSSPWMGLVLQWPVSFAQFHAWSHMDLSTSIMWVLTCEDKTRSQFHSMLWFSILATNFDQLRYLLCPMLLIH